MVSKKLEVREVSRALSVKAKPVKQLLAKSRSPLVVESHGAHSVDARLLPQLALALHQRGVPVGEGIMALCTHALHVERNLRERESRIVSLLRELAALNERLDQRQSKIEELQVERVAAEARAAEIATHFGDRAFDIVEGEPSMRKHVKVGDSEVTGVGTELFGFNMQLPAWATPLVLTVLAFAGGYRVAYIQQEKVLGFQGKIQEQTAWLAGILDKTTEERKAELDRKRNELAAERKKLEQTQQEREKFRSQIEASRSEINSLGSDKEGLEEKVDLLTRQVSKYESEITRLEGVNKALSAQANELTGLVEGLRIALDEATSSASGSPTSRPSGS